MQQASLLDERWSAVLAGLPASLDLEKTARDCGAASLLRLALAYGPCGLSLRGVAAWAELCGLGSLSDLAPSRRRAVAVLNRLRGAADWLEHIVGAILSAGCQADAAAAPLGRRLRLVDGTCVSRPGSTGTDWRVHVTYDLAGGRFSHFEVSDRHGAEDLRRGPVAPGEIRIADRNYARLKGLRHIVQGGGDVIVRTGWCKVKLCQPDGAPARLREGARFDLFAALATVGEDRPGDFPVLVADRPGRPGLPVRLVALRKSAAAAEQERQRLRRLASKKGKRLDPRTLIAAEYMLLLTSLPQAGFAPDLVVALYRLRWQIELAFKRLKSLAGFDRLPAKDPALARSWLYAHLIVALLIDDLSQEFLDSPPCAGRRRAAPAVALAAAQAIARRAPRGDPRRPRRSRHH